MESVPEKDLAILLAGVLMESAAEQFPRLVEGGYGEDQVSEAFVRGYLLASANFASQRGWSDEKICAYLDRFVTRIRSGEAQASAERARAEWSAKNEVR